jgi:hypothetical protein
MKKKVHTNKFIITKAKTGKTVFILTQEEYKQQVNNFIHDSKFTITNNNPSQQYQNTINTKT